jgi:hypothetical protein
MRGPLIPPLTRARTSEMPQFVLWHLRVRCLIGIIIIFAEFLRPSSQPSLKHIRPPRRIRTLYLPKPNHLHSSPDSLRPRWRGRDRSHRSALPGRELQRSETEQNQSAACASPNHKHRAVMAVEHSWPIHTWSLVVDRQCFVCEFLHRFFHGGGVGSINAAAGTAAATAILFVHDEIQELPIY